MVKESYETVPKSPPPSPPPAQPAPAPAKAPVAEPVSEEATFQCPNCNGIVKESDNVCPHCGAMFVEDEAAKFECPACSTLVDASATKCPGCGALFVEDTEAVPETAKPQEAPAAPVVPAAAPAPQPAVETKAPAAEAAKDEDLDRIIEVTKRIKESREAEAASKASQDKKSKRPGLFKVGGKKEAEVEKPAPMPAVKPQEPAIAPTQPAAPVVPPVKREFPTDPREQGKDLARLVAEVRALLGTATERDIFIDEAKALLDHSIVAGRDRQFLQALEAITDAKEKLQTQLKDYVSATFTSMREEIEIAKRLGGDPSRADMLLNEAFRASQTPDYQAALVFIDKAKSELSPITGRYNETKNALRKFERLVKDARSIGIDTEPLKVVLEDAKISFSALNFPKTEGMLKTSTDEVIAQIPDRMSKEIEKAKQMLIEAKMKSDVGVTPQITILKSAIKDMKEEKYIEAMSEMKKFKKEMKKILNPA